MHRRLWQLLLPEVVGFEGSLVLFMRSRGKMMEGGGASPGTTRIEFRCRSASGCTIYPTVTLGSDTFHASARRSRLTRQTCTVAQRLCWFEYSKYENTRLVRFLATQNERFYLIIPIIYIPHFSRLEN